MKVHKTAGCDCDSYEANQSLLSVEDARAVALALAQPIPGLELVSLSEAIGRVLAKTLHAPAAMPFFDNSAMDGYAVSVSQLRGDGPWSMPIGLTSAAGDSPAQFMQLDPVLSALRIFTGAPVPDGYDAVVPQENCLVTNGILRIETRPKPGLNIRYAGSDMQRGAVLLEAGSLISAHHIGLLAANGYGSVNVRKRPKVAIFSTGDELLWPGEKAIPGKIYDCNKPMLAAMLAEMGLAVDDLGVLPDNPAMMRTLLKNLGDGYDLILSTGSISTGERDFLKAAFQAVGGRMENWKVAIKPGKPIMFGKLGKSVFTGLPGNPFAAYVGFQLFVKPQLMRLSGASDQLENTLIGAADFNWQRKPGRSEVFPVRLSGQIAGGLAKIERLGNSVSATLFPLSSADGLAQVPADCVQIKPGDLIQWQPF